ncbi:MAG TPA: STAS domain-containing protein [Gaiellaceae bacterium]|nr:STAS domain-containing protein [Gaiellaceae bacterium]
MGDVADSEERRRRLREQPVIDVEQRGDAYVVRLGGELDLYNADKVRTALLDVAGRAPERLVLDLEQVEFVDSTALGALIEARASMPNRRGLLLAQPNIETRRALQVSGLDRHLPVHDSVDAALATKL